eukprot:5632571-Amphidinium_carterae.1
MQKRALSGCSSTSALAAEDFPPTYVTVVPALKVRRFMGMPYPLPTVKPRNRTWITYFLFAQARPKGVPGKSYDRVHTLLETRLTLEPVEPD